MSDRYWNGEWPNLNSLSIAIHNSLHLTATEIGILYRLVWYIGARGVHGYYKTRTEAAHLPLDPEKICRIAGCSAREWESAQKEVLSYFRETLRGYELLDEELIRLSKPSGRQAVPTHVKNAAIQRAGVICAYCGDENGPFDLDHLYPVARGGTDEANNIVVACASCNRSKGAKTLKEWRGI